ncbi:MAG TPA: sigma-70 family RNA polymerase sigma factor [Candidatus Acidoferrum sp.]|nr:sigma-70 family RNA polymerase sigma factor [Candidatus Acidoferrum sp.]
MERRAVIAQAVTETCADDALVSAARAGDRSAFGLLYDRYARMVHGILLCRVPPREVDDLVQEVFLLALRKLDSLRDFSRFGAWLSTITRNRANDYYRDARRVEQPIEPAEEEKAQSRANDHAAEQEAAMTLAVLRMLPETYREPLMLRLVEGMNGPEIAARMGMTHGSVRVNLHRGMQMLREKLGEKAQGRHADHAMGEPGAPGKASSAE